MAAEPAARAAFWHVTAGACAGILGAFFSHAAVLLAHRYGEAGTWLKGPHGPPFFDLAFSTAWFYAFLGTALGGLHGRNLKAIISAALRGGLSAFFLAFLVLALPLALATRIFTWGEGPTDSETLAWFYLVLVAYAVANMAAWGSIGYTCGPHGSWRRTAWVLLAGMVAYMLQWLYWRFFPQSGTEPEVIGWLAPPSALYSGIVWGTFIGLAVGLGDGRWLKRPR